MRADTDIAALAAAAIAVPLTVIGPPGPYDAIDLVVGVTLMVLLFAYAYKDGEAKPPQRLAVACVAGLVTIPVAGGIVDQLRSCQFPHVEGVKLVTCMGDQWAVFVWVAAAAVAFALDPKLRRFSN